jgi:CheY-like chemotaxis protein
MRTVRVLLVDDSDEFRHLLERLLLRFGFQIVGSVTGGEEALARLRSAQPDIVILDIAMPGLNGLEVARRIRQDDADIGLIILSMHATPEYRQAAAAIGVDAYVVKDDLVPDLQNALRRLSGAAGKAVSS